MMQEPMLQLRVCPVTGYYSADNIGTERHGFCLGAGAGGAVFHVRQSHIWWTIPPSLSIHAYHLLQTSIFFL